MYKVNIYFLKSKIILKCKSYNNQPYSSKFCSYCHKLSIGYLINNSHLCRINMKFKLYKQYKVIHIINMYFKNLDRRLKHNLNKRIHQNKLHMERRNFHKCYSSSILLMYYNLNIQQRVQCKLHMELYNLNMRLHLNNIHLNKMSMLKQIQNIFCKQNCNLNIPYHLSKFHQYKNYNQQQLYKLCKENHIKCMMIH